MSDIMTKEQSTEWMLNHGNEFPYAEMETKDWAVKAVYGVLAELGDRRGVGQELDQIDEKIREEIVDSLASLIRLSYERYSK